MGLWGQRRKNKKEDKAKAHWLPRYMIGFIVLVFLVYILLWVLEWKNGIQVKGFIDQVQAVAEKLNKLLFNFFISTSIVLSFFLIIVLITQPPKLMKRKVINFLLNTKEMTLDAKFFKIVWEKPDARIFFDELVKESSIQLTEQEIRTCTDALAKTNQSAPAYICAVAKSCMMKIYEKDDVKVVVASHKKQGWENIELGGYPSKLYINIYIIDDINDVLENQPSKRLSDANKNDILLTINSLYILCKLNLALPEPVVYNNVEGSLKGDEENGQ